MINIKDSALIVGKKEKNFSDVKPVTQDFSETRTT